MPKALQKYWWLFQVAWQNQFTYRASLVIWRFRSFLGTFVALSVWSAFFMNDQHLFGYSHQSMVTYIFLVAVIQNAILSTSLHSLASQVYSGQISYQLIKPINLWVYLATEDFADKLKNILFVLIESVALYAIFKPIISFPNVTNLILFILWVGLGTLLHFVINILFGAFGFWSPDVWGPKFLFFMFVEFTSGKLYPIDILPKILQDIFYLTPFPYLSYVQTQLFLKRFTVAEVLTTTGIMIVWIVGLSFITKKIWQFGLKHYVAAGQ